MELTVHRYMAAHLAAVLRHIHSPVRRTLPAVGIRQGISQVQQKDPEVAAVHPHKLKTKDMRRIYFTCAFAALLSLLCREHLLAQAKADIFDTDQPITWLGLDFSQMAYIGRAMQFHDAGKITARQLRDKYIPAWNELFLAEAKKYDVADAVRRENVTYATSVTAKANAASPNTFFQSNSAKYKTLMAGKVADLVRRYDFQGKTGIGLMFFVEGMDKERNEAGAWAVFVNMKTHAVLLAEYETGRPGGMGFRNYWAKAFLEILENLGKDYRRWRRDYR